MPAYEWTCFSCHSVSPAGTDICVHCGFPAYASGKEIKAVRTESPELLERLHTAGVTQNEDKPMGPGAALLLILFGIYLFVGGVYSVLMGKWSVFMPPQLDLFAVPLSLISEKAGGYIGGTLAGLIGGFCVLGGVAWITNSSNT